MARNTQLISIKFKELNFTWIHMMYYLLTSYFYDIYFHDYGI